MYDTNRTSLRKPLPYSYFHVSFWLIGINVLAYFMGSRIMLFSGSLPLENLFYLNTVAIRAGTGYWGVFTYMFAHGGFAHIFVNMLTLFFVGPALEQKMGSWEFLIFYLLTGTLVGGAALSIYLLLGTNTILLGASGAVFASLLGFATYYPHAVVRVWGILPIRAPILVLVYTGIEVFGILKQIITSSHSGTSHLGHLFGLLFGFLYLVIRLGKNPIKAFSRKTHASTNYF